MGSLNEEPHSRFAVVHPHSCEGDMRTHRGSPRLVGSTLALAMVTACGQATLQQGSSPSALRVTGDSPVAFNNEAGRVRGEELVRTNGSSLYEALVRARPQFLRGTGIPNPRGDVNPPSVRLNGVRLGTPEELKLVQVGVVTDVRYLRPVAAANVYGVTCDCPGGVIEVTARSKQ